MFPRPTKVDRPPHSASPMTPLRVPTTQHLQQQMLSRLYYDRLAYRHPTDPARGPHEMPRGTAYPPRQADPYYRTRYPYHGTNPSQARIAPESYRHPIQTVGYRSGSGTGWCTMPGIVPRMPRPQLYQPQQTIANAERLSNGDIRIQDGTGRKNDLDAVTVLEVRPNNGLGSKNDLNAEMQQKETHTQILRTNPGSTDGIKENGVVKVMTVEDKAQKGLEDDPTDSTKNAPQKNYADSHKQTPLAVSQRLGQEIPIRVGERETTNSNGPTVRKISIEKVEQNLYNKERPTVSGLIPTNGIRQMYETEKPVVLKLLDSNFNKVNGTGNARQPETNFYKLRPNTEPQKQPLSHAGKVAQKQLELLALEVRPRQKYPNPNSKPLPLGHISSMKRGVVHAFRQISPSKMEVVTSSSTILGLGIQPRMPVSSAYSENRPTPPLSGVTSAIHNPGIRHQVLTSAQDGHNYSRPPMNASTSTNQNAGIRPVVFPRAPGSENYHTPLEIATVTPASQNNGVTFKIPVVTDSISKPETVAKQSQNIGLKVSEPVSMSNGQSPPQENTESSLASPSPDIRPIVPVSPVATVDSASENVPEKHPKPPFNELTMATPNHKLNNASKIVHTSSTLASENTDLISVTQKCLTQDGLNLSSQVDQKSQKQPVINAPKAVNESSDIRPETTDNVEVISQHVPPAKSAMPSIIQKSPEINMSTPTIQKSQIQSLITASVTGLEPVVTTTLVPTSEKLELVNTTLTSGGQKSPSKSTANPHNTGTENAVTKTIVTTSPPVGLWKTACATSESIDQKPSSAPTVNPPVTVGQITQSHPAITLSAPPSQKVSTWIPSGIFTPTPGFKSYKMQLHNNANSGQDTLSAITYSIPSNPSSSLQTGILQVPPNRQNSNEQQRNILSIQNDQNSLLQEQINNYNLRMDTFRRMQRERYLNSSTMSQNSQKQPGASCQMSESQNCQMPRGISDSTPISRSLQTQLGACYPMSSQQYQMQHAYMYPKSTSQNYQTQSRAMYSTAASQYSQMQLGYQYWTPMSQTARIQARINSQMETSQNFPMQPMITNQSTIPSNAGVNIGAVYPAGINNNNSGMQSGTINPIEVSQSSQMQAQNSRLTSENIQAQPGILNPTVTSQKSQAQHGTMNLTEKSQNYGMQPQINNPMAIIQNNEMQHGANSHTAFTRNTGLQPQMNNSTKTSQNPEPRTNNPTKMSPDTDIRMNNPTAMSQNSEPRMNNPTTMSQNSQMQPQIKNPNVSSHNSQMQLGINNSAAKSQNLQMQTQINNPAIISQNSQMHSQINNPNVSSQNSQVQPGINNSAAKSQNSQMQIQINNSAGISQNSQMQHQINNPNVSSQHSQVQPKPMNRCETSHDSASQHGTQDSRVLTMNAGNQLDVTPSTQINQNSGNLKRSAAQLGNNLNDNDTAFKKPRKYAPRQKDQAQTQISTTQARVAPLSQSIPSAQNSETLHRNNTEIRDARGNQISRQGVVTKPTSNAMPTTVRDSYTSLSNRNDIDIEILDGGGNRNSRQTVVITKTASNVVPTTVQNSHMSLFDRIDIEILDGGGNRIPHQSVVKKPAPHAPPPTLRIGSSISLTPIRPLLTPKVESDTRSVVMISQDESPGRRLSSHVCDVCNRVFLSDATLRHHKTTRCKIQIYDCRMCPAQFRAEQDYRLHRQYYHKMAQGFEMAIPLVDLRDDEVKNRMAKLGVRNYIPLSQITCESNGHFGIPIMAADGESNALRALNLAGVSNVFSLGPIKELPR